VNPKHLTSLYCPGCGAFQGKVARVDYIVVPCARCRHDVVYDAAANETLQRESEHPPKGRKRVYVMLPEKALSSSETPHSSRGHK
jgi:hypothetical protein